MTVRLKWLTEYTVIKALADANINGPVNCFLMYINLMGFYVTVRTLNIWRQHLKRYQGLILIVFLVLNLHLMQVFHWSRPGGN